MSKGGSQIHYGWIILLVGFIGVMGSLGFGRFAYTPILPSMKEGLSFTYTQMGWIGTGNFIGYLSFAFIGGYLATRLGSRRGYFCFSRPRRLRPDLNRLVGFLRICLDHAFLIGAGSAGSNVPIMALASAWFTSQRRGMATGILVSGSSVALLLLGPLIPYILQSFPGSGWRVCWYFLGGLTLLIAFLNYLFLRNRPEEMNLKPFGRPSPPPAFSSSGSVRNIYTSAALWHLAAVFFTFGFSYIIYMQYFSAYLINEAKVGAAKSRRIFDAPGGLEHFLRAFLGDGLGPDRPKIRIGSRVFNPGNLLSPLWSDSLALRLSCLRPSSSASPPGPFPLLLRRLSAIRWGRVWPPLLWALSS